MPNEAENEGEIMLRGIACFFMAFFCFVPVALSEPDLVGVWQCQIAIMGIPAIVETTYEEDGTFVSASHGQTGMVTRHWGTYVAGDNFIRFSYEGHEPRQYCGPSGCHALALPKAETTYFRVIDANTLEIWPAVCMTPPCQCVFRRIR